MKTIETAIVSRLNHKHMNGYIHREENFTNLEGLEVPFTTQTGADLQTDKLDEAEVKGRAYNFKLIDTLLSGEEDPRITILVCDIDTEIEIPEGAFFKLAYMADFDGAYDDKKSFKGEVEITSVFTCPLDVWDVGNQTFRS